MSTVLRIATWFLMALAVAHFGIAGFYFVAGAIFASSVHDPQESNPMDYLESIVFWPVELGKVIRRFLTTSDLFTE